jgi:hypothetical protein
MLLNVSTVHENHSRVQFGIILDKRITWRLRIEMIEAKAFRTFIRVRD